MGRLAASLTSWGPGQVLVPKYLCHICTNFFIDSEYTSMIYCIWYCFFFGDHVWVCNQRRISGRAIWGLWAAFSAFHLVLLLNSSSYTCLMKSVLTCILYTSNITCTDTKKYTCRTTIRVDDFGKDTGTVTGCRNWWLLIPWVMKSHATQRSLGAPTCSTVIDRISDGLPEGVSSKPNLQGVAVAPMTTAKICPISSRESVVALLIVFLISDTMMIVWRNGGKSASFCPKWKSWRKMTMSGSHDWVLSGRVEVSKANFAVNVCMESCTVALPRSSKCWRTKRKVVGVPEVSSILVQTSATKHFFE